MAKTRILSNKAYRDCGGSECVVCQSGNLERHDEGMVDWETFCTVECLDCKSTWTEISAITGYENLERGKNVKDG